MVRLLPLPLLLLAACDVFTARVPCAVDDECGDDEACVDGFCAADDGGGGREGEGEGEGERPVESHPLRSTQCSAPAAASIADPALRCSIFGVFEEPCDVDADCGDPAAPFCVDPGPGPRICAASADLRRSACPDGPGDPDAVLDANVDDPFDCLDGSLSFTPSLKCNASGTSFAGPDPLVGGDMTFRMSRRVDDAVFCTALEFLSFGTTVVGGDFRVAPDDGSDGEQPPLLRAVVLSDAVAVFGDVVITDTRFITTPAFGGLERVLGDIILTRNTALADINLFSLIEVDGDLILEDNPALDTIINTEPTRIGGRLVVRNSPLVTCAMLAPLIDAAEGEVVIEGIADGPCP